MDDMRQPTNANDDDRWCTERKIKAKNKKEKFDSGRYGCGTLNRVVASDTECYEQLYSSNFIEKIK